MDNHAGGHANTAYFISLASTTFTISLPTGIQWLTRSKPIKLFFFESGYFMNKANDCLMIGSYVCGLFLHIDKNHILFLLETNKSRKVFAF